MLGNNRDYVTSARQAERSLKAHYELTQKYIASGLSKNEASKKAYDDVIRLKITGKK